MTRDNVLGRVLRAVFQQVPIMVDRSACPVCRTIGVRRREEWFCINCGHRWDGGDGSVVRASKVIELQGKERT